MKYSFDQEQLSNFSQNIHREWVLTNGIGGYAGSSILGAHNRTHQGYLIASLHPPVERYLVFSKTNERILQQEQIYDLETSQHAGEELVQKTVITKNEIPDAYKSVDTVTVASDFSIRKPVYSQGNRYLTSFTYDGTIEFAYVAGTVSFTKSIAMVRGENTVAIAYDIYNEGEDASFVITPLMNYREHNASARPEDLVFQESTREHGFTLIPRANTNCAIDLQVSEGSLQFRKQRYDIDMQLQTEVDNETPGLDCHYMPYDIVIDLPAGVHRRVSLVCSVDKRYRDVFADTAFKMMHYQKEYVSNLLEQAGYKDDDFANTLVAAADQFLSYRTSTQLTTVLAGLPWFTDWGRDTMIAFSGLTLATHRFDKAREILKTFSQYVHHGMVPNMFPDNGLEPLYNTADASLWYFYAVDQYLRYDNSPQGDAFIQKEIFPSLKLIIEAYKKGTDFSIYMEEDGLIHAGSGVDQVTWMDVRVGDWVVTPRHGKPVEINALWYNALCVMDVLSKKYKEYDTSYIELAAQVKESFNQKFWYEEGQYLYDVVDGTEGDSSLRPNQIYAVSLPYTMLDEKRAQAVVKIVEEKLYAQTGIRSLSPNHKDYHPVYCGSLPKRDAAYHQGTSWGFLMGGFITAYVKVHKHSPEAIEKAKEFLQPVAEHFKEGCIGSISEIFDGDAPHTCRGCYAQAWSVGEVLRCYTEDILGFKK